MNKPVEDISTEWAELKIVVVVPTYNNERTLAAVLDSLLEYASDIIVVNDGSTDDTGSILENYAEKLQVISYFPNRGKGYAIRRGFETAVKRGFRYAVTIDSDGQHFASDLPVFVRAIEQHPGSLLVGDRGMTHENKPGGSTFANRFSNFWFTVQTGIRLPDTQSGYRLYPLEKMGKMKLFTRRYEAELELLVFSAWRNIPVLPVPIKVYYAPKEEKVSHFRPFQDFFRISVLNTVMVFLAVLYGYTSVFIRRWLKK